MTSGLFLELFRTLAIQLRDKQTTPANGLSYYQALKDLDIELVQMAATDLAKTSEWFPKTSEWRRAALRIEKDRTRALEQDLRRLQQPLCGECQDTGWTTPNPRVRRCACQALRRLEVLGRRPWPVTSEKA